MSLVVDWVHPSVRDAVIDYLMVHDQERLRFLQTLSIQGALLALSSAGGASGDRQLPLMVADEDWEALGVRMTNLAAVVDSLGSIPLLRALEAVWQSKNLDIGVAAQLRQLSESVLAAMRHHWYDGGAIEYSALRLYYSVAERASLFVDAPKLSATWRRCEELFRATLEEDIEDASEAVSIVTLLEREEPRYLRTRRYTKLIQGSCERWIAVVGDRLSAMEELDPDETGYFSYDDDHEEAGAEQPVPPSPTEEEERGWLDEIGPLLELLEGLTGWEDARVGELMRDASERLEVREARVRNWENYLQERDSDRESYGSSSSGDVFDFDEFFDDL